MRSRLGGWRLAARLAGREVSRHPWRHALVVVMIFVPMLFAFATFSGLATVRAISERERFFVHAGAAVDDEPGVTDLDTLPEGAVVESRWEGADWLVTGRERVDGRGPVLAGMRVLEAPFGSRSAARFVVERGRLPKGGDEILISPPLAEAGGWRIGDTVESARTARRFEVVGIGPSGNETDVPVAAVADVPPDYWITTEGPDRDEFVVDLGSSVLGLQSNLSTRVWLPEGTDPSDLGSQLSDDGDPVFPDARVGPAITLGLAAMAAMVAVVASAAFAIASRRQLRTVGLLSTAGADPATIRTALVLQGAIPGLLAGLAAVVLGLATIVGANASGVPERLSHVAGAQVVASLGGAVLAVVLGLGAGVLAAWQPARTAARIPVLSALAGRRPLGPVPTRVPIAGAAAWLGGVALIFAGFRAEPDPGSTAQTMQLLLLIGGIAGLALGGVGLAPLVVAVLGHMAGWVSGTTRLALRGLSRHRTQSAATVAAVGIALALPVGLLTARSARAAEAPPEQSNELQPPVNIRNDRTAMVNFGGVVTGPTATDAEQRVRALLGPSAVRVRSYLLVDDQRSQVGVAVIDEADAPAVLSPAAAGAIVAGKAISLSGYRRASSLGGSDAAIPIDITNLGGRRTAQLGSTGSGYLIGKTALGDAVVGRNVVGTAILRPRPLSPTTLRAIEAVPGHEADPLDSGERKMPTLEEIRRPSPPADASDGSFSFTVDRAGDLNFTVPQVDGGRRNQDLLLLGLSVAAGAVALLVLTITLSLRSVDTESEHRAAIAAGAPPAKMRRQRAVEGLVLAGLGAALAVPLGWLPVTAGRAGFAARNAAMRGDDTAIGVFHLPGWPVIPILVVPVLLAGLGWLVFPALAAALRRTPRDQVIERW